MAEDKTLRLTRIAEQILARCREIAQCTEVSGQTTRTFLSPPMHDVHKLLRNWMEAASMRVHVDGIGNLRGVYPSQEGASGPRLLIGSHLDTVPNAGAFDGILGVVLGLALVEELQGVRLPFAIEVIGFSEEEGVRFGKPFLGSLVLIGEFDEELLVQTDKLGIRVADAARGFELDPATIQDAALREGEAFGYLEVHIEQGPVLESETLKLGVVDAIVGQTRLEMTFLGQANHAGTTPMALRHDAMAAAAAWMVAVEAYARGRAGLVATVGRVETKPGVGNVVAGEVIATLDLRHADDAVRHEAEQAMLAAAQHAATERGVRVASREMLQQAAVPMDARLSELLAAAAERAGYQARRMVSGAGHDAMIVARKVPAAMLFLRSPGGLSHHPDEDVFVEDVEAAVATGLEFLRGLVDDGRLGREHPTVREGVTDGDA